MKIPTSKSGILEYIANKETLFIVPDFIIVNISDYFYSKEFYIADIKNFGE
jgi:hypothetical protein